MKTCPKQSKSDTHSLPGDDETSSVYLSDDAIEDIKKGNFVHVTGNFQNVTGDFRRIKRKEKIRREEELCLSLERHFAPCGEAVNVHTTKDVTGNIREVFIGFHTKKEMKKALKLSGSELKISVATPTTLKVSKARKHLRRGGRSTESTDAKKKE